MNEKPKIALRGVVGSRGDVPALLKAPGDTVIIERGRPRWLMMRCPCGCGEDIPINLDPRSGPAWRLYRNAKTGLTLFPSVWRDTGCLSHFIIWRNNILLFGHRGDDYWPETQTERGALLDKQVLELLSIRKFVPYVEIADALNEIPWDILWICRGLVRRGLAREGSGEQRGHFARA
jgi:hypothetical protein